MQTAFAPTAPFWREHGYWRADQGYFSYLLPLTGDDDSSSKPTTSPPPPPPRLGIEAVIRQALWPLAVRAFPEVAQAATAGACGCV